MNSIPTLLLVIASTGPIRMVHADRVSNTIDVCVNEAADRKSGFGLQVASIFMIFLCASCGSMLPVFLQLNCSLRVPTWALFVPKHFGSGIIIGTAFLHLLSPAVVALRDPCLDGVLNDFDWASGIVLTTIFIVFVTEFSINRSQHFVHSNGGAPESRDSVATSPSTNSKGPDDKVSQGDTVPDCDPPAQDVGQGSPEAQRTQNDIERASRSPASIHEYNSRLTSILILISGLIFHSIFTGLTLAVSGGKFDILLGVFLFHDIIEALTLGARLAEIPWPPSKKWVPYILGCSYSLSTPTSLAIGLVVIKILHFSARATLIINGVLDSISAGLLIYAGLVEMMAHEFVFDQHMQRTTPQVAWSALSLMVVGTALMAVVALFD